MARPLSPPPAGRASLQQGASLIVVLILLIVVSLLGVGSIQIATMGERSARNDRDQQIAWQAAEAALMDAELDMDPNGMGLGSRRSSFAPITDASAFVLNCGSSSTNRGLCAENPSGKPAWLVVDFLSTSSPKTAGWGDFTGRNNPTPYPTGGGLKSFQAPRYVIEAIKDPAEVQTKGIVESRYVYRVTAMGFGPRQDIQAVMQMIYRD
ncbi:pilus assembly PilX family protein [Curvibacter lanceolatus]|jgi:type IV pilus assembly protein PilX|uniref:pilus assembly PilX family protein n=1 Tax=Curvibacter lanceolatus TaxID=86182 RepID=UPI0023569717|nr:PilX N-terminal domain-containing pilus assembly protein [Curvibacter lanceolatus]